MSAVETRVHRDSAGSVTFERVQDVEAILERNKALQNESQNTRTGWHHVASIPNIIIEKWCNEKQVAYRELMQDFDGVVMRMLRDPDYQWLRTTSKRF